MKSTTAVLLAAGALLLADTAPLEAQAVESIMRSRERLELTEEQLASLDEIRRENVARRAAESAEMAELRSRLAAGDLRRSELMAAMEDRRAAANGVAEERRSRIEAILTEAQLETLEQTRVRANRARAGARRAPGFRDRGPRARGPNRPVRRGFGPRARFRAR